MRDNAAGRFRGECVRQSMAMDVASEVLEAPVGKRVAAKRAPWHVLLLPFAFTLGLAAFLFLDSIRQNTALTGTFAGTAAALLAWNSALLASAVRRGRTL